MNTLPEIIEKLKHIDEITLLEVLEISSEDIVDRFSDKIEERIDIIEKDIDD